MIPQNDYSPGPGETELEIQSRRNALPQLRSSCPSDATDSSQIDLRTVLTVLAAEILRAKNMPAIFATDWGFCKTTPIKDRVKCGVAGRAAHEQCRQWALKLAEIARSLPTAPESTQERIEEQLRIALDGHPESEPTNL